MSTMERSELCQEAEQELSDLLEGSAKAALHDHVAECDECRDLKHEAAIAAARMRDAGADFRPGADFLDKLVGRLEAARPASSAPRSRQVDDGGLTRGQTALRPPNPPSETRPSEGSTVVIRTGPIDPGGETARTVFDPMAEAKVAEAEAESRRSGSTTQPSGAGPTRA